MIVSLQILFQNIMRCWWSVLIHVSCKINLVWDHRKTLMKTDVWIRTRPWRQLIKDNNIDLYSRVFAAYNSDLFWNHTW